MLNRKKKKEKESNDNNNSISGSEHEGAATDSQVLLPRKASRHRSFASATSGRSVSTNATSNSTKSQSRSQPINKNNINKNKKNGKKSVMSRLFRKKKMKQHVNDKNGVSLATVTTTASATTMTTATTTTTNTHNGIEMHMSSLSTSASASASASALPINTNSDESSNKENNTQKPTTQPLTKDNRISISSITNTKNNNSNNMSSQQTLDRILDNESDISSSSSSSHSSDDHSDDDDDDDDSSNNNSSSSSSSTDMYSATDTFSHSQESSLFNMNKIGGSGERQIPQSIEESDSDDDDDDDDDDDEYTNEHDSQTYGSGTLGDNSTLITSTSVFGGGVGGCINSIPDPSSIAAWDNTWEHIVCGGGGGDDDGDNNNDSSYIHGDGSTTVNSKTQSERYGEGDTVIEENGGSSNNNENTQVDIQSTPRRGIHSETSSITRNIEDRDTNKHCTSQKKKKRKEERAKKSESLLLTRSALSRPFGRTSLPAHLAKNWIIEIATPEFHETKGQWTYNILVQKEEYRERNTVSLANTTAANTNEDTSSTSNNNNNPDFSSVPLNLSSCSSFATANVSRTINDFIWLQQELQREYHGSLLLPILSLTLSSGTDWTTAETMDRDLFEKGEWDPVELSEQKLRDVMKSKAMIDPKLLADWLSDVFNFVRGKGELIFHGRHAVDIMSSESVEMFLYQTSRPLPSPSFGNDPGSTDYNLNGNSSWLKTLTFGGGGGGGKSTPVDPKLTNPMNTVMNCISAVTNCGGADFLDEENYQTSGLVKSDSILSRRNKVHGMTNDNKERDSTISYQSNVIKTQKTAIDYQRENVLRAMYRLRILLDHEAMISGAWKRFAISVSNLFSFEKDIENCKVGDKIKISDSYKSKVLSKKVVEDSLRILTRQKMDRAIPSLKVLSGMLSALFADFSCTESSLEAYSDAIKYVKELRSQRDINNPTSISFCNEMEEALATNESRMQVSLLQLCNATYIRVARMSWKYFKMESGQAQLLSSASMKLKKKLEGGGVICDLDLLQKQELEDDEKEVELVQQLLNLGSKKKYKHSPLAGSSIQIESDNSDHSDYSDCNTEEQDINEESTTQSPQVQTALTMAKERIGRWDAELALAIMEAVGVQDADVLMEETTRDLRQVRKLAVKLREKVDRCNDAIDMLHDYSFGGADIGKEATYPANVFRVRDRFFSELATAFGGSSGSQTLAQNKLLHKIGTNMKDLAGWATALDPTRNMESKKGSKLTRRCGECTAVYQKIREEESQIFFEKIRQMLHEYELQIERLDNFVYVQCVGIQIEKYFSTQRADALAAWEKKTDINAAINIATRKRLPQVVDELNAKLENLGADISHTSVKEAKNRHLGSKSLKSELDALAHRRFQRLKQTSTQKVVEMSKLWAEREEYSASMETSSLKEVIKEIESIVATHEDYIRADGGAHLFALTSAINGSTVGTSTIGSAATSNMPKAW